MHVQYNTPGELADALAKDAHARKAIAKHFKVSEAALLDYIRTNLVLTTTTTTIKVPNYGLTPKGYMYYKISTFKPGLKVWATRDGKPVIKWICTNPITMTLPAAPAAVAKVPVKRVAPPPPPPPVVVEKPVEKPVVVEKPKPVVVEKPTPPPPVVETPVEVEKPVVVEKPTPPPAPKPVEPPKPPVQKAVQVPKPVLPLIDPCTLISAGSKTRFNFKYGKVNYADSNNDKFSAKNQTGLFGVSFDIQQSPRTATSLYADYVRNSHQAICSESLGYGIERRVYLHCVQQATRPFYGAGIGNYKSLYQTLPQQTIGKPSGLGGKLFVGLETRRHAFIELGQQLLKQQPILGNPAKKINLNNTYVAAGFRF